MNKEIIKGVKNAGSIFLGCLSPEAMGDYITGSNHVLPTNGTAKFSSSLSVFDFMKRVAITKVNKNGFKKPLIYQSLSNADYGLSLNGNLLKQFNRLEFKLVIPIKHYFRKSQNLY